MNFSQPVRCRRQEKNSYLVEDVYKDRRFVWNEWPAQLVFHRDDDGPAGRVTITMPGMPVYSGERLS